jgi:hypothetical protein
LYQVGHEKIADMLLMANHGRIIKNWGNGPRRGLACDVRLTTRRNHGVANCPDLHDYELRRRPRVEAGLPVDTSIVSVFH